MSISERSPDGALAKSGIGLSARAHQGERPSSRAMAPDFASLYPGYKLLIKRVMATKQ